MSDSPQNRPIISVAISPRISSDREKLQRALSVLIQDDPTLQIKTESVTGQTTLGGMSDLHLEECCNRILLEFNIPLDVWGLKVIYLESIRRHAEGEGKYIRQTGGFINYAHCKLRIEPNDPGKGNKFINCIKGDALPRQYVQSIDEGVQKALEEGIRAGHPMVDINITLIDGSHHETGSNEMSFKIAGSMAFKDAARKALPILLEPVMDVKITVPEEHMGTIIGDLNSRSGRIEGIEQTTTGSQVINATVPLAEMLGYGKDIHSGTQGRAQHSMRFARYEAAPYRGGPNDEGPYITANKPTRPKTGSGLAAARWDLEVE